MRNRARGQVDVVVAFFTVHADLERRLGDLGTVGVPGGRSLGRLAQEDLRGRDGHDRPCGAGARPSHRIGRQQGVCHRRDLDGPEAGLATGEPILVPALTAILRSADGAPNPNAKRRCRGDSRWVVWRETGHHLRRLPGGRGHGSGRSPRRSQAPAGMAGLPAHPVGGDGLPARSVFRLAPDRAPPDRRPDPSGRRRRAAAGGFLPGAQWAQQWTGGTGGLGRLPQRRLLGPAHRRGAHRAYGKHDLGPGQRGHLRPQCRCAST